jgi:hypothetical protein
MKNITILKKLLSQIQTERRRMEGDDDFLKEIERSFDDEITERLIDEGTDLVKIGILKGHI